MKPQIKISELVQRRLELLKEPCLGSLYGIFIKNTLLILGLKLDNEENLNIANSLPAEVDLCGILEAYSDHYNAEAVLKRAKNIDVTDNPTFLSVKLGSNKNQISANLVSNNQVDTVKHSVSTEQEIYTDFLHVHLEGDFHIKADLNAQSLTDNFTSLRKSIASGCMAFTVDQKNIILVSNGSSGNEVGVIGLYNENPSIGEICEDASEAAESGGRKRKGQNFKLDIVEMKMVKQTTVHHSTGEHHHCPIVIIDRKHSQLLDLNIRIDFLALIHKQNKLSTLYPILLECAIRNLRQYESVILQKMAEKDAWGDSKYQAKMVHFFPKDCGHFLSRVDLGEPEESQKKERELLHRVLILSADVPRFRRANQYTFKAEHKMSNLLENTHEGVKPTDNGGKVCLVKGRYQYYHYCQNNMDDNGWGCAYRSLQTLASWFKLQGYTEKEVPTFKEIQQCLVDIGDKPSSFVGSRQWIGSTEVSFVLNALLGVTSKILFVSSGEEMGSQGPELVNHFENHGSPIMIGGGVLAHTILGVDYNQQLGTLKFLILDPHYTGSEDLHVVQSKGWCGWKGVEFWDKTAYYNMCMPQVPREI